MGRRVVFATAVVVAAASAVTVAVAAKKEEPTIVRAGNLVLRVDANVKPKTLPKEGLAPMSFRASGRLSTVDGSHVPAVEEADFDSDKDVVVNARGLPSCRIGQLKARAPREAEAVCGDAIVGRGSATAEVEFPEQPIFESTGPLILFNGGERGGAVTVFGYAYVSVPAPTAVITTVKLFRQRKGPYGLRTMVEVPKIAGGAGSFVAGHFTVHRTFIYRGKRRSFLSGRCSDGRLQARGTFRFGDGTQISGALVRACTVVAG